MSHFDQKPRRILVTLATGKQGASAVKALAQRNSRSPNRYEILAVTRKASSEKAKNLAKLPGVVIVECEYVPALLFSIAQTHGGGGPIHGVFSVQQSIDNTDGGLEREVAQGVEMIDESAKAGVAHFVYSSVDLGGMENTDVPHFESKRKIETHLRRNSSLPWTILRPTSFMENISHGTALMDKLINTGMVAALQSPMQLIACSDIGEFAAIAFDRPEEFLRRELSLAGDNLNGQQMQKVFRQASGRELATTYFAIGRFGIVAQKELRLMFKFFNSHGYKADISACRALYPGLLSFEEWVKATNASYYER